MPTYATDMRYVTSGNTVHLNFTRNSFTDGYPYYLEEVVIQKYTGGTGTTNVVTLSYGMYPTAPYADYWRYFTTSFSQTSGTTETYRIRSRYGASRYYYSADFDVYVPTPTEYSVYTYTGDTTITLTAGHRIEYVVGAGGGGGGSVSVNGFNHSSGGGGAGGVLYGVIPESTAGDYDIIIGAGGAGATTGQTVGARGEDTWFSGTSLQIHTYGGGGGGSDGYYGTSGGSYGGHGIVGGYQETFGITPQGMGAGPYGNNGSGTGGGGAAAFGDWNGGQSGYPGYGVTLGIGGSAYVYGSGGFGGQAWGGGYPHDGGDATTYSSAGGAAVMYNSSTPRHGGDGMQGVVILKFIPAPIVTTSAATNVSFTTATGGGCISYSGDSTITDRGICWSTGATPTIANSHKHVTGTTGCFSASMTGLTSGCTTYYVRAFCVNGLGTFYGDIKTFKTVGTMSAGSTAADQTIDYGDAPAQLTTPTAPSCGTLPYNLLWQYTTGGTGGTYINLAGNVLPSYQPPALYADRWYRKRVIDSGSPAQTGYTNSIKITVTPPTVYAGIIGDAQSGVCSGTPPEELYTITAPSGGTSGYTFTYQWYSGTTSGATGLISGATGTTYQPPFLYQNTWYRKKVTNNGAVDYTPSILIELNLVTVGVIGDAQTIYSGQQPAELTGTTDTGSGTISYYWQSNTDGSSYMQNNLATTKNYQPPILTGNTWYRRTTKSTIGGDYCWTNSNIIKITVKTTVWSDVGQSNCTCYGIGTGAIYLSNPSGATGSNYESSIDGGATWQTYGNYLNLPAGTYDVWVRDADDIYNSALISIVNILQPNPLYAAVAYTDCSYIGSNDGTITFSAPSGGSGNYNYSIDAGVTWQASTNFTGLAPQTYYPAVRDSADLSCFILLADLTIVVSFTLAPFCTGVNYTITDASCGGTGKISINDINYLTYYTFTLTDALGVSYSLTGLDFIIPSGYYFLTATPLPAYAYYYSTCSLSWLPVNDVDTTLSLTMIVRPTETSYLRSVNAGARVYGDWSDSVSGLTHDYYLFNVLTGVVLQVTGSTDPSGFVYQPAENGTYYGYIVNANGCKKLTGVIHVQNAQQPFNLSGIKKCYIAKYFDSVDWNNWRTDDEDYFVQSLDVLKFQSAKIKAFTNITQWYSLPTSDDSRFEQKMVKVRQGYVFNNVLTLSFSPSTYNKWIATGTLLDYNWIVVFQDLNDNWFCFGYQNQGAKVRSYSRKSDYNYYALEFSCNSSDKILTAIDYKNYVLPIIINS
jgi:hypothetical protein